MRYTIIIIAALALLTTSSCVKKYTCECKLESYNSNGEVEKSSYTDDINTISKKDAKSVCDLGDDNVDNTTHRLVTIRQCELK